MHTVEYKLSRIEIAKEWLIYEAFRRYECFVIISIISLIVIIELTSGPFSNINSIFDFYPEVTIVLIYIGYLYVLAVLKKNPVLRTKVTLEFNRDLIRFTTSRKNMRFVFLTIINAGKTENISFCIVLTALWKLIRDFCLDLICTL